jgi:anti-sigma regulatory factor (Ser/Thr protein kinase)
MTAMEKSFPRDFAVLDDIHAFVQEYLAAEGIEPANCYWADFIIEELFTNFVKYSKGGRSEIKVRLDADGDQIVIRVTDFDVEAFDITKVPEVDLEQWATEGRDGGLGIHLVKQIADTITYEYEDRNSIVTVRKRLEN